MLIGGLGYKGQPPSPACEVLGPCHSCGLADAISGGALCVTPPRNCSERCIDLSEATVPGSQALWRRLRGPHIRC